MADEDELKEGDVDAQADGVDESPEQEGASDEVLTESEIDALMESVDESAAGNPDADDGEYRRFDFAAREQSLLREFTALTPLMERQAELLGVALDKAFSIEFAVRSEAPVLLSVADVLAALDRAVAVTTTTLSPLPGPAFVVSPAALLFFVTNAYFGGGNAATQNTRETLTPTEIRIAERIAEQQINCLVGAWQDKLAMEGGDLATLGVADRIEMLPRGDILLKLTFTLAVGDFEGRAHVLIPFSELEPYRARFAPPRSKDDVEAGSNWEPYLRRELPGIDLELAGVLDTRSIALADLLELRAGTVLPLAPPEVVRLQADGVTLGEGRYGTFEGMKAVQLARLGNLDRD